MQSSRRNRVHSQCLIVLALLLASSAYAQAPVDPNNPTCPPLDTMDAGPETPMSFRVEAHQQTQILLAEGTFDAHVAQRLEQFLSQNRSVDEIWLKSAGGVASQGPALGKIIRHYGIPTRVPAGWWCVSACSLAFLGGPIRYVDVGGMYVVHMFTTTNAKAYREKIRSDKTRGNEYDILNDIAEREQSSAQTASEQNDYMLRMGISRKLLADVMYKQKASTFDLHDRSVVRCMTQDEMHRYNVVNAQ